MSLIYDCNLLRSKGYKWCLGKICLEMETRHTTRITSISVKRLIWYLDYEYEDGRPQVDIKNVTALTSVLYCWKDDIGLKFPCRVRISDNDCLRTSIKFSFVVIMVRMTWRLAIRTHLSAGELPLDVQFLGIGPRGGVVEDEHLVRSMKCRNEKGRVPSYRYIYEVWVASLDAHFWSSPKLSSRSTLSIVIPKADQDDIRQYRSTCSFYFANLI
jgi:hypothetical protein